MQKGEQQQYLKQEGWDQKQLEHQRMWQELIRRKKERKQ
jgi:hypothetical protein